MKIVFLGLSITSSWGNGHATTFRSLIKGLNKNGHEVLFLERDMPWYSQQRDLISPEYCKVFLYNSVSDLKHQFSKDVREADAVIVGSYVPEGVKVGTWVTETAHGVKAFYDIDTPVTFLKLQMGDYEYIHPGIIPLYDIYFSFTGGPALRTLMTKLGSPSAKPLYCSVDTDQYFPQELTPKWDLGYLGTYSDDRQPGLENLMIDAARKWQEGRFIVAGPQYPASIVWSGNIERVDHLSPADHSKFYGEQRYTLNITRKEMKKWGYSPSVRLFEAAACGTPVISDYWDGLEQLFEPGEEILIAKNPDDTIRFLKDIPDHQRVKIGSKARQKVINAHSGQHRAKELEQHILELQLHKVRRKNSIPKV